MHQSARVPACLAVVLICLSTNAAARAPNSHDMVEMTTVVNGFYDDAVVCSPSGTRCVFVSRRNDVATRSTTYTLFAFARAQAVSAVVDAAAPAPQLTKVISFETHRTLYSGLNGIDHLAWLDERTLSFVARSEATQDISQVFLLDMNTRRLRQVTRHNKDVYAFALSSDRNTVVYSASAEPDAHINEPFFPGNYWESESAQNRGFARWSLDYFVSAGGRAARRIVDCRESDVPTPVSISASGRYAAIVCHPAAVPEYWRQYTFFGIYFRSGLPALRDGHFYEVETAGRFRFLYRLRLIDLQSLVATELATGPAGRVTRVVFSPDDKWLAVDNVYPLPEHCAAPGACQRSADNLIAPAERGRALILDRAANRSLGLLPPGAHIDAWTSRQDFDVIARRDGRDVRAHYRLGAGAPTLIADTPVARDGVSFKQEEGFTAASELVATGANNQRRTLTHFNDALSGLDIGSTEHIAWTTPDGEFEIDLTSPKGVAADRRLALLVSLTSPTLTFGGWPEIVARNIRVASPTCRSAPPPGLHDVWEGEAGANIYRRCFEAVVTELDRRGMIDRNRVGISGISNFGAKSMEIATFSDFPIAAASVTDSYGITPMGYAAGYGNGMGMASMDADDAHADIGAPLWGPEGLATWLERSAFFNLDRLRTPMRFQFNDYGQAVAYVETHAVLRRMHQPSELVMVPDETHAPSSAFGQYFFRESQADWFDFWLNDREDNDSAKAAQYVRWRQFRAEQDALADIPRPPRRRWTAAPIASP